MREPPANAPGCTTLENAGAAAARLDPLHHAGDKALEVQLHVWSRTIRVGGTSLTFDQVDWLQAVLGAMLDRGRAFTPSEPGGS